MKTGDVLEIVFGYLIYTSTYNLLWNNDFMASFLYQHRANMFIIFGAWAFTLLISVAVLFFLLYLYNKITRRI